MTERGPPKPPSKVNPTLIALLGGVAILILVIAFFATIGIANQDRLTDNELVQVAPAADPAKRCAAAATYDMIKRDLFRRAAELRGSDQAAYDRLAAAAVVRMENPVLESEDSNTRAINCSGSLSLDLPPGVAVVGGRRTLMADVDYTIQRAADGSGDVVLLKNADAIVAPLATLARTAPAPQPSAPIGSNALAPVDPLAPVPEGRQLRRRHRPHPAVRASTARMPGPGERSRFARTAASPRSTSTWSPSTGARSRLPRRRGARCCNRPATASSPIATAAPAARASPTPTPAGCGRSATLWKAAGSRRDKSWISKRRSFQPVAKPLIFEG